ncbi:MAG: hypothetical protein L3J82_08185 [Planctomycetes bacterium]|nr:hypothetical protein [Planctomycetota bacterium]
MTDENHNLELLLQKLVDGEITEAERAELDSALGADSSLRDTLETLQAADSAMNLLKREWTLPADFKQRVLAGLPEEAQAGGKVIPLPSRTPAMFAAAAAIILMLGLVFAGNALMPSGPSGSNPAGIEPVANAANNVNDTVPAKTFTVELVSGNDATLEHDGQRRSMKTTQQVELPIVIESSATTHTTIRAGDATLVLQPGARARLLDIDADGVADFEPLEGDIYIESNRNVRARFSDTTLETKGGLMFRQQDSAYLAEPSHGETLIAGSSLAFKQCARISISGVAVSDCPDSELDDWVIDGRIDAIKAVLREGGFDPDNHPDAEMQEKMLRGMLAEPSKAAYNAAAIRFMLKHKFLEELGLPEEQVVMFAKIGEIIGEGTTEADIPEFLPALFKMMEQKIAQDPTAVKRQAAWMRQAIERAGERKGYGE